MGRLHYNRRVDPFLWRVVCHLLWNLERPGKATTRYTTRMAGAHEAVCFCLLGPLRMLVVIFSDFVNYS